MENLSSSLWWSWTMTFILAVGNLFLYFKLEGKKDFDQNMALMKIAVSLTESPYLINVVTDKYKRLLQAIREGETRE